MCRLWYVEGEKGTNEEFVKKVTYALAYLSHEKGNKDGYSIYIDKKKKCKTVIFDTYINFILKNNYKKTIGHCRLATTGKIAIHNCHIWDFKINNKKFVAGHNGIVREYSSYGYYHNKYNYYNYEYGIDKLSIIYENDTKTDSYRFFEYIFKKKILYKPKKIEETIYDKGFDGVAMILEKNFKELIIIATETFYCAKYQQNENIAYVISSKRDILDIEKARLKRTIKENTKIFCFDVENEITVKEPIFNKEELQKEIKPIPEGIYYISLENRKIINQHPL
jgi:predicted glutamine amidotransferase